MIEKRIDVVGQIPRGLVAPLAILLHRGADDGLDIPAQGSVNRTEPGRFLIQHQSGSLGHGYAGNVVGQRIAQQFIQNHAQAVDVAADVEIMRIGLNLLRAHVLNGADELAHVGLKGGNRQVGISGPGHPEIDDLHVPGRIRQNIGGFEVAMDDAFLMPVMHRIADRCEQAETLTHIEILFPGVLRQGEGVGDVLHDEVGDRLAVVVVSARFVDLSDSRMTQAGEDLRFILETSQRGA